MTAISSPILDERPGPDTAPLDHRKDAFLRARKHSARVRRLRIAVPALGVLAIALVVVGWGISTLNIPSIGLFDIAITDDGIAMDAPVLRGEDDDGRPYEVRAERAFQTLGDEPVVTMHALEGRLQLDETDWATLRAPFARLDSQTNQLAFEEGDVEITLSSGEEAFLGVATIDLENGTLLSDQPVRVLGRDMSLDAQGVEASEGGARFLFKGDVRMVVTPQQNEAP
ncbi:MAG: hypothetical protein AAF590_08975 [Pseudomonadota bacterium]